MISKNPLVLKIAENTPGDELLKYLLSRQLAFTEEEYLESLVFVLPDPKSREQARKMLGLIPQPVKEQYVQKREADLRVIDFILQEALETGYFNTLTLIIQNQGIPAEFILRIAARAKAAVLETLLENQIRLIAYPEIMEQHGGQPRLQSLHPRPHPRAARILPAAQGCRGHSRGRGHDRADHGDRRGAPG